MRSPRLGGLCRLLIALLSAPRGAAQLSAAQWTALIQNIETSSKLNTVPGSTLERTKCGLKQGTSSHQTTLDIESS